MALELPEASDQIWGEAHVARTPADEANRRRHGGARSGPAGDRPGSPHRAVRGRAGAGPVGRAAGLLAGQALTDEQIERAVAGVQAEAAPVGRLSWRRRLPAGDGWAC